MEPFSININVSIEVKDSTIEKITNAFAMLAAASMMKNNPEAVQDLASEMKKDQSSAPAVEVKAEAPKAPQADASDEIPNQVLFEAIKAAQKERGVAKDDIKALFAKFNISTSRECPQDKRAELLSQINALNHAE